VTFRLAALDRSDRAGLESLLRATGAFSDPEIAVGLEVFEADDPDYRFVAAYATGTAPVPAAATSAARGALLGYACFGPTPGTDRGFDLYWIAVHPSAQRAGVGSALLAAAESAMRAEHARLIVIETSSREDYAPTRAFYLRHGYTEVARVAGYYAAGDDRVILARRGQAPSAGRRAVAA
jgi:ribosomal protein S18 acetylase RimI-like enzyme